jgi:hypothetical protein
MATVIANPIEARESTAAADGSFRSAPGDPYLRYGLELMGSRKVTGNPKKLPSWHLAPANFANGANGESPAAAIKASEAPAKFCRD